VLEDVHLKDAGEIAYAIIPLISTLPQPLKSQVQNIFSACLKRVWIAFTICNGIGFLSFFAMKNYPLKKTIDGKWGIDREKAQSR